MNVSYESLVIRIGRMVGFAKYGRFILHTTSMYLINALTRTYTTSWISIFDGWRRPSFSAPLLLVLASMPSQFEPLDVHLAGVRPVQTLVTNPTVGGGDAYTETAHNCFIEFPLGAGSCNRIGDLLRVFDDKL